MEQLERVNYLYQLATVLTISHPELARAYGSNIASVSAKTRVPVLPSVKRTVCKGCRRILIPGVTCSQELENKSKSSKKENDILLITCKCGKAKRYPIGKNRDYKLKGPKDWKQPVKTKKNKQNKKDTKTPMKK